MKHQKTLVVAILALFLTACIGGGGGESTQAASTPPDNNQNISTNPGQTTNVFTISGRVTNPDNSALQGIQVSLGGAATSSTITNVFGDFQFSGLNPGNYAISSSAVGMSFSPTSQAISITSQSVGNINFVRFYKTTNEIKSYMDLLHTQTISEFISSESALSSSLSAKGMYRSGNHYKLSSDSFLAKIQEFSSKAKSYAVQRNLIEKIDTLAVKSMLSQHSKSDTAYIDNYYRSVDWGLTGTALNDFIKDVTAKTTAIYDLAILEIP